MSSAMKYKRDFLKDNRVTARQFQLKYVAFMESSPDEQAYREFAKKWNINIYPGLGKCWLKPNLKRMRASIGYWNTPNNRSSLL